MYDIRVADLVLSNDRGRAIRGGIVVNQHLERPRRLLADKAFEGLPHQLFLVVRQANDRYLNLTHG